MAASRQNSRNILEKSPAGDVREPPDLPLLDERKKRPDINASRLQQDFAKRAAAFAGHGLVEVPAFILNDPPYQREAVAVHAGARKAEDGITGSDARTREHVIALDCSNTEAREVVVAFRIHARHLGGLAADQSTTSLPASFSNRSNHRRGYLIVQLPRRIIIEEKQRLGALDDEIVSAHRNEVDAYAVMTPRFDC